jgi:hypothetical protein
MICQGRRRLLAVSGRRFSCCDRHRIRRRDLDHARGSAVALERGSPPGATQEVLIGRIREHDLAPDQLHGVQAERFSVDPVECFEGTVAVTHR